MNEVTLERFNDMLDVLPPMYIDTIDGKRVGEGFAVSEALSDKDGSPTFAAFWKEGDKCFGQEVLVTRPSGKNVGWNYYNAAFSKGNKAISVIGGYGDKTGV